MVLICIYLIMGKFSIPSFNSTWTENFQMFKLDLENAEEPERKLPAYIGLYKKQEDSRKIIYFCFNEYAKTFDWVDLSKLWKNSSRDGNKRPPYPSPEKPVRSSRSNNLNWAWNTRLVPNREKSMSRMYIANLLI